MEQFNTDVSRFINKRFNITYNSSIKSFTQTGNTLSIYYGRMIICIFINQQNSKFIATFGDFETGIHFNDHNDTKIIKNIKQHNIPYMRDYCCGLLSYICYNYELHITCDDNSKIILNSHMPFKIYDTYDDIHADNPTDYQDFDHNY